MRKAIPCCLFLFAGLLGCDHSSRTGTPSAVPAEIAPLQSCLNGSVETLTDALATLADLARQLSDPLAATSLVPTGDPLVWIWSLGNLSGTAAFSRDPTGGPQVGDSVLVGWTYADSGGSAFGTGSFTVTLAGPTTLSIHGSGVLEDPVDSCRLDIDIAESDPLRVALPVLAANLGGFQVSGVMAALLTGGGDTLGADLVFEEGSNTLLVRNAVFNGNPVADFRIPLSAAPAAGAWDGTWALTYSCSGPGGVFDGNATIEIEHAGNATTFTGVEREPGIELPFQNVSIRGNEATLTIEYDRGDGRTIREEQVFRLAPDGRSFTKTSTARYLDDGSVFVSCTGTALKQ